MPSTLKIATVWLLLGLAVFLGFQALERERSRPALRLETDGAITLHRAADGHYHWPGSVNGQPVDFLVDTGASRSALPQALAEAAGLKALGIVHSDTAGGRAQGWQARAQLALEGGLRAEDWPVTVLPALQTPLLGMDLLGRMDWQQSGDTLTLRPR